MQSGISWGYIGLVEGLVQRIRAERGERMDVIATGGLAPLFAGVPIFDHVDSDLNLWGLRLIYHLNRNK
jgi:type III pantothenate kinase